MKENINFESISITNDVMFVSVFRNSENCKELLQRILGINIEELMIVESEKSIRTGVSRKGIRLDVYVRDVEGNSYDIEMKLVDTKELDLQSRYYHSEMDGYQIKRGQKYKNLKESIVIFVCAFDMFGKNYSIYTFETICKEDRTIQLNDKRKTVFVNILGDREGIGEDTIRLLDYLKTGEVTDKFTASLQKKVVEFRNDDEWRENYMTLEMKLDQRYDEGVSQGEIKGKINSIIMLLSDMGDVSEELETSICKITAEEKLNDLLRLAASCDSIDEFVAKAEL